MKKLKAFHLYTIALVLAIAGNFLIKRDSVFYYPHGFVCIFIVLMAVRKQYQANKTS